MGDSDFVPFVPRRASHASDEPPAREQAMEDNGLGEPVEVAYERASSDAPRASDDSVDDEIRRDMVTHDSMSEPSSAMTDAVLTSAVVQSVAAEACDHSLAIRNEAIRLAAIACGRALRHAVMLHPAIIARFVDDAIEAAGYPAHARIRVHADSVAAITAPDHDRIAHERLSPGDGTVECDGTSVGATLLKRASLLVSAAAG